MTLDERFMKETLRLAEQAAAHGNEPFGAVLVKDDEIVFTNENQIYSASDPTYHAEAGLLRNFCAAERITVSEDFAGDDAQRLRWRLDGDTLIVQPCASGAQAQSSNAPASAPAIRLSKAEKLGPPRGIEITNRRIGLAPSSSHP